MASQSQIIGRLEQVDPGQYVDEAGNRFTGNPMGSNGYDPSGLTYAGTGAPKTSPTNGQLSTGYDAGGNLSYAGASPAAPAAATAPLAPSSGPNPVTTPAPAPAPSAAPTPVAPVSAPTDPSGVSAAMRAILVNQMQDASSPTTLTSPDVAPAVAAYDTQSQRDEQRMRDQLAEDAYAKSGGDLSVNGMGGFNTAVAQNAENAARGRASFAGSQVAQVAQQKRSQLVSMLQIASQYGLTDQAQQIQAQIASIDALLRQQGITNQLGEFGTTAGLTQQQITNQNTQANNALGFNYSALIAQMNRDALLAGLQG